MGSIKYRVAQEHNGKMKYYGHFSGHDPKEAIYKASKKAGEVLPFDFSRPFEVKHGFDIAEVIYER